jgi:putative cardiolipin synthase
MPYKFSLFFLFLKFVDLQVSASEDSITIYKELSIRKEITTSKTGIYALENGGKSLMARLWLFDHARQSIDIQYYSFAKDVTGLIATDHVVRAAERGVKIRILVDDAAARMYSYQLETLDSHQNIEVRVYNAGLILGRLDRRIKHLAKNRNRLLRRMHNKTLTIDGQLCIMGGRNIADEYFDYDRHYNFRDRDLLLLGKGVDAIKISYNKFWNHELTVLYSELSGKAGKKWYNNAKDFERLHKRAERSKEFPEEMRNKIDLFAGEIKAAQTSGELSWLDEISFISDKPGKNEERPEREGGISLDSLTELFKRAEHEIIIQSPYFILSNTYRKMLKAAIDRGVKIRLLTNSLGSTDNFEAFSGYQKDRKEILEIGVSIWEFKPDAKVRYKIMIPERQTIYKYKPTFGFHSKTIIIDGKISVIGSYNFDPRSANYNTECISVLRSKVFSDHLLKYVEEEFLPENSWPITQECNPDHKAKLKKRIKVYSRRIIPKKLL